MSPIPILEANLSATIVRAAYAAVVAEHVKWLRGFERWRRLNWDRLLEHDPESAIVEALVRRALVASVGDVEPSEQRSSGGPDFYCPAQSLHVDARCVTIATMTEATGLLPAMAVGQSYRLATERVREIIISKTKQAASVNAPALVAIGTLHFAGAFLCLGRDHATDVLTGGSRFGWFIGSDGAAIGDGFTFRDHRESSMVVNDGNGFGGINRAVSGVLLLGVRAIDPVESPARVRAALTLLRHPDARHPLIWTPLPGVKTASLAGGWRDGRAEIEWS